MSDEPTKDRQSPAIRLLSGKPSRELFVAANRAGYRTLRDAFASMADSTAGAFATESDEALRVGRALSENIVPGSDYVLVECALDESLSHEPSSRTATRMWLYDRLGLAGCAALLVGALLAASIFLRGLVAVWHDLQ